ncbi:MarR family transcriptional regulator [Piscinibacter sp. XHJ-5]|uniref:MarR family winged helix-turn-helix transcriptional regulator n=1 Tax=Piscinibacter sp. XHJ-5 TaxID=3037797 RepID=UPI0024533E87|nr:MarR family transcriptional regulator [Piscinibacter sp. XHJ-5]
MANRKASGGDTTPAGNLDEARLHGVIGYQIAQASIATLGVFHRLVGEPLGLRPVEFTILVLIKENPGGTAARLARALAVTAPNIKLWLERLEGRMLIRREASASDRRTQHIHVTEEGRQIAESATQRLIEGERLAFSHLSNGERAILIELLHKVARKRDETS